MERIILVAEDAEFRMVKKYLPEFKCLNTGVGASNVIKTCCLIPADAIVYNIGYAGSNNLEIGTVTLVSETRRLMDDTYQFTDYHNPLRLSESGFPCYTSNSFVTASQLREPTLFDMELNYIAAFPFKLGGAVKVVSDNLCLDAFRNNAIRESGILTAPEVWEKVASLFRTIAE